MYLLTQGQFDLLGNARWELPEDSVRIGTMDNPHGKHGRGMRGSGRGSRQAAGNRLSGGLKRWDSRGEMHVPKGLAWLVQTPRNSDRSPKKQFGGSPTSRNTIFR